MHRPLFFVICIFFLVLRSYLAVTFFFLLCMRKVIEHYKTSTVHVSVMYVCFSCINKVLHLKKKKLTGE